MFYSGQILQYISPYDRNSDCLFVYLGTEYILRGEERIWGRWWDVGQHHKLYTNKETIKEI